MSGKKSAVYVWGENLLLRMLDPQGMRAIDLVDAAIDGNIQKIQRLIARGANVNGDGILLSTAFAPARKFSGRALALQLAVAHGHNHVAEVLERAGASFDRSLSRHYVGFLIPKEKSVFAKAASALSYVPKLVPRISALRERRLSSV